MANNSGTPSTTTARVLTQALQSWPKAFRASMLITVIMFDWFLLSRIFG
ncbi:hypothetical protein PSH03_005909 [Micromonospora sp. PSH03]|nr:MULTISPECIES: hypothetical protein [Micromonospora]MBQ0991667.1 hypothetical protein [Micromonospora sp. H61]MCG5460107.1 hypothetical protein [Micromonospora salmantinae]